jgi:hypothetical protein
LRSRPRSTGSAAALIDAAITTFPGYPTSPIGAKLGTSKEVRIPGGLDGFNSAFYPEDGSAFDDYTIKAMGEAFDAACRALHDKGQPQVVYEVIAKHIIDAAKRGERDIARLRVAGLAALGLRNDDKRAL